MKRLSASIVCVAMTALSANATGLAQSFRAATEHDETFRAQRLEREARHFAVPIARAALLPSISLNSVYQTNRGERTQTLFGLESSQALDYRSQQSVLSLRQPLYHREGWIRHEQGKLQAAQADEVLRAQRIDLMLQVASAYFDVLFAEDTLALVDAEAASAQEQMHAARDRYARGEGTLTEVAEAQARHELADARRIDARDRIVTTKAEFTRLTGLSQPALKRPGPESAHTPLDPPALSGWMELARTHNAELQALRVQSANARLEVDRNRSGHHPRVDLVASVTDARNDTLNTLNTASLVRSAGIQVTLPILAGGGVVAATDQAVLMREKMDAELNAATRTTLERVRSRFLGVQGAIAKLPVYERAVAASRTALEGTQLGFMAGIRTNIDVLDAQRQLQVARRELAQARYVHLLGILQLKAVAGTLTEQTLEDIDRSHVATTPR